MITLIFVVHLAADPSAAEPAAYWVYLCERGGARVEVSARARERRADRGAAAAEFDVPPRAEHVEQLARAVARVRVTSRWLNAVSVDATAQQIVAVRALPFVSAVVPVGRGSSDDRPSPPTPRAWGPEPWPLELTAIDKLHARGLTGKGVRIGVIDSGFELGHVAFAGLEVAAARDFIQGDDEVADEPGDAPGQAEHGTQTLGVLAGRVAGEYEGAAPMATYFLAKTEHVDDLVADEDRYVAGLEWLEAQGVDLISTSVGFFYEYTPDKFDGESTAASKATRVAVDHGVHVVAAAGNAGPSRHTVGAPADVDGVLAVGAVDKSGMLASFSSRGPTADGRIKPDVVAPGVFVWTVAPGTLDEYAPVGGTSIAAPLAAGAAALVLESAHGLPINPLDRLRLTADNAGAPNSAIGWGLIDAAAAAGPAEIADKGGCSVVPDPPRPLAFMLSVLLLIRRRRSNAG